MSDLIKREDVIAVIKRCKDRLQGKGLTYEIMLDMVERIPSVDRPRGKWIDRHGNIVPQTSHSAFCSNCGEWSEYLTNYCGHCNADMRDPTAADRSAWIPCSERLPKEGEIVLIYMKPEAKYDWEEQRFIEFGRLSSNRYDVKGTGWEWLNESAADFWEPDWNNCIVAWMPLPEPWRGADDE